jgi:hypothetical protein
MEGAIVRAAVTISIDLELEIDHFSGPRQTALDRIRDRLIEMCADQQIAATWAVADPARSAASDLILASGRGHEIAVLGDRTWLGRGAGRLRTQRELARRFEGARRVGMSMTTLALRHSDLPLDMNWLAPHGITALREPIERGANALASDSAGSHPAIWQAPPAHNVPSLHGWRFFRGWLLERELQRTIRQRGLLHFGLSAPQLIGAPPAAMHELESLVARLGRYQRQASLAVVTLSHLARQRLAQRVAIPAKSILHSAA